MKEDCPRNRFLAWLEKDNKRAEHEWTKWDGTEQHGIGINDIQCERIDKAKIALNCPNGLAFCKPDCECAMHFGSIPG